MDAVRRGARRILTTALAGVTVAIWLVAGWRIASVAPAADLAASERSVSSPGGQDGVLERICEIIEPTHRFLVDLGAGDGVEGSSSRNLIAQHGWRGLLVEPSPGPGALLEERYAGHDGVKILQAGVYPGDVEILMERARVPADLDLLIVGLEGNDWYVWRAIDEFRPKVVEIGYNAAFVPPQTMVIEYHPLNYWDGSLYFGASIQSLYALGQRKGYELVYADRGGTTLFFVEKRYFPRFGIPDNAPIRLYVPRQGFPLLNPTLVWDVVGYDGRPRDESMRTLVREDVRVERTWVVGER